ncbi:MAG: hypothetical protein Q7O12_06155 [Deltaproteobacteria bacterium]|nr:hypothetical protein [Deltaproteobacteria bacterium]
MKRMITMCMLLIMGSLTSGSVPQAHGALNYLPIPFEYNSDNTVRDVNYPTGTPVVLGGIPFNIPSSPNLNTWDSIIGAPTGPKTIPIPVNRANVREVHTLFNCSWGSPGRQWTTLDFYWSGGTVDQIVLTAGVDIRDWWNAGWVDTTTPPTVQVYSGTGPPPHSLPTRIDKQIFVFDDPSYAGKVLEKIVVTDNGADGVYRAFLYGLTVAFSPDAGPGIFLLMD